ncbi:uncharacterized protein LOC128985864 isoform X1 [Macrosteles quadrilineatus]|uniref:uncharacterized protein LOC128985864 isoform X1 n=1 Tax=Macrosteles quadrilineatus TaxID=74068 RepID=UPI0023E1554E|nr:uncharacterized protein LOC128985864 isoform X1 [Macrosteles quadrilineatus]
MGLMLSILVFCVGVVEILDCWDHFLVHLVQPHYNPLPKNSDHKPESSDHDLQQSSSESRRPSHDICWPKDLSPDDDLHVIKKRSHDVDQESHRVKKESSHTIPLKHVDGATPDTVVLRPESPQCDSPISPCLSRETSPNRLELGVIVESDSSSELDEPSQIENINYRKLKDEYAEGGVNGVGGSISRPKTPHAMLLAGESEDNEMGLDSETSFPGLPVFTDTILSHDARRVDVYHSTCTGNVDLSSSLRDVQAFDDFNLEDCDDVEISNALDEQNAEGERSDCVQPISLLLDEGLEPISEYPEIKVHDSSPVPDDDSDTSLNTSDASWLVRSKTSDRPLVIRFHSSPEKIEQDFQSVVQTDLHALGEQRSLDKGLPSLEKAESLDVYYDAQENQNNGQASQQNSQECIENVSEIPNEVDSNPTANYMLIENSSSSSLSGIPPLPEDTYESLTHSCLATDNGFSLSNDSASIDLSYTQSDKSPSFYLTSDDSDISRFIQSQQSSDLDYNSLRPTVGTESYNVSSAEDKNISHVPSVEAINLSDADKQKASLQNAMKYEYEEIVPQGRSLLEDDKAKTETPILENVVLVQKEIEKRSSEEATCKGEVKTDDISKNTYATSKQEIESKETKLSVTPKQPQAKNIPSSDSNTSDKNLVLDKTQASSGSAAPSTSKSNIPSNDQETASTVEPSKKVLPQPKDKPLTKEKSKTSSNTSSNDNNNTAVPSTGAIPHDDKEKDSLSKTSSVKTEPELKTNVIIAEKPVTVTAGPSKPRDEAKPSTSKEEDKAFWLIFSGEYTKAMNKDWHSGHFCCWQCDESLTGQRYVLRDEHPYCVKCYESVFANGCEECNKIIGIDSKDLSYKDKHWHEACFLCNKCRVSLVDKQFGSKLEKIFCGNCYDQQFASRCDGCGQIFKAGTKKMEYKTRQWHEPCFSCCVCKSPIGTKSFIPREQEIYCANCYEEKFATRCVKCNKIITSGGVTYKNEPWHRECFTCTHCNTSLAGQRFTSRDEKPYCAECFGELFAKRCTACSKPITGIGGTRFISFEDRHWHNDCFICASCKTTLVGRGFITDGDDIICPECAKQKLM